MKDLKQKQKSQVLSITDFYKPKEKKNNFVLPKYSLYNSKAPRKGLFTTRFQKIGGVKKDTILRESIVSQGKETVITR